MTIAELADALVIAEGDRLAVEEPVGEPPPPEQATRQTRATTIAFRTLLVTPQRGHTFRAFDNRGFSTAGWPDDPWHATPTWMSD